VLAASAYLALRRPAATVAPPLDPSPAVGPAGSGTAAANTAEPTPAVVSVATPQPAWSPAAAAPPTPAQALAPAVASPQPRPSAIVSGSSNARLDRANALFESRHYQSALNEARAVLARQPDNEEARALVEDAAAALLVEEKLRNARAALGRGDRTTALSEVRAGLAAAPNDARLVALQKQLAR
jgi:hypothetical protein